MLLSDFMQLRARWLKNLDANDPSTWTVNSLEWFPFLVASDVQIVITIYILVEKMDQERLRVLALPVLLQILQQVVLEIIAPGWWNWRVAMAVVEGGGGNSYAGYVIMIVTWMDVEQTVIVLWLEMEVILLLVPAFWSLSRADTVAIIAKTGAQEDTKLAINTTRATNTKIVGIDAWMASLFYIMAWSRTWP